MTEEALCAICGEPSTRFFGNSPSQPLCENVVCEVFLVEKINLMLETANLLEDAGIDVSVIKGSL